jgi:ribosomal-protein-alanine N-acetyltransferase
MTNQTDEFPQLETRRLLLREVRPEDSQAIFHNYADPRVTEYFIEEPLVNQQQAVAIVQEYAGHYRAGTGLVWAITLKGDPTLVGTCGYEVLSPYDKRGEIGYDLARAHWGQGVMKEALQAVIAYGFESLGLNRIQAYVLAENARSIALLRGLHFEVEGVLREHRWFGGRYRDNVIMSLLKNDWQSNEGDWAHGRSQQ